MESVILVIHLFLALAIIGLVLMQRSEGGGLGIGGGGGGAGNFASPKGTANFMTRMTAICAAAFFVTSLTLGVLAGTHTSNNVGILDALEETSAPIEAPLEADAIPVQLEQEAPEDNGEIPSAPIAE